MLDFETELFTSNYSTRNYRKSYNLRSFCFLKSKPNPPMSFTSHLIGPVKGRQSDRQSVLKKSVDDRKTNESKKSQRNA